MDDQDAFRSALRELVEATEGFQLIGEAESGEAALTAVERMAPRMVIMDRRMPGMGGAEAARILVARHPRIVTLLVSINPPEPECTPSDGAVAVAAKQELSRALLQEVWREHGRDH